MSRSRSRSGLGVSRSVSESVSECLGVVSESVSECLGVGLGVDGVETASASE